MAANPEKPLLNEKTVSVIVTPDGKSARYPTVWLSHEDAILLRDYKRFLLRHQLKEALYCSDCYENNLEHGCEAFVTPTDILIRCRCRARVYKGQTL